MSDALLRFYNWRVVGAYLPQFVQGLEVTLGVSAAALVLALLAGALLAAARGRETGWVARWAGVYVECVRATPLLAQLYLLYYGLGELPLLGRKPSELECGVIALGLNNAAYIGEILRGGIASVPSGNREAARALGLRPWTAFRTVILPQAVVAAAPALVGQAAMLVKDSALVSFIGVSELTAAGMALMSDRLMPNEGFLTIAAGYLVLYGVLAVTAAALARRLGRWRRA